jgi:DNA-binding MarR family transcriptional regulator
VTLAATFLAEDEIAVVLQVAREMGEPGLAAPASILDLLNYQLHLLLSFSTAEVTRLCEREHGITRHEWGYIGLLAAFGPLAPSELALRSGMDRSRTSKALMPLLAKGLVSRQSKVGDRRYATVALSAAGKRLYAQMFPQVLAIHQALLQPLTAEEVQVLGRALAKLRPQAVALSTTCPRPRGSDPRDSQETV